MNMWVGAQGLWNSLPPEFREQGKAYTDFWESYQDVFPADQLQQGGKETGNTNHIERFNNTMRQRISRLVRKTLSFSKKLENHIGAIWNFIHHYNASLTNTYPILTHEALPANFWASVSDFCKI
jgi:insertion element IS1 protein InsB